MTAELELFEEWVEDWHNSALRYCDVPDRHHSAWLREQGNWLLTGPRWPPNPTDNMVKHCQYWWPKVNALMANHGWSLSCIEDPDQGYVVVWQNGDKTLHGMGPSAHYAAITSAAIVRRKARYYNLWQSSNGHKERGCV